MNFFEIIKAYPLQILKTALCCLSFIGVGAYMSITGPTLLDLQTLTHTSIKKVALILPVRSFGYAVGSIIVGVIGEFIDHQTIVIFCLIINCFTSFFISCIYVINLIYVVFFISGIALGAIDTISNVWLIHMWGKENPSFIQLLHFFYGIGSFVIPFASEPFLSNENYKNSDFFNSTLKNITFNDKINQEVSRIYWPYRFITIYNLIILLIFIIVYCKNPSNEPHPSRKTGNNENQEYQTQKFLKEHLSLKFIVIAIAILFMHTFIGLEVSFGSLLTTFAVKSNLKLSKSDGSYLSGLYWASFTFFRLITFFVIPIFSSKQLLIICLSMIMLSNGILLPFASNYEVALCVGSIMMGLDCSSVFATMLSFIEQFTPVNSKIASSFMVSACVGEFIFPYIVGLYIEKNPEVYLYVVFIYSLLTSIFFIILTIILSFLHKKQNKKN